LTWHCLESQVKVWCGCFCSSMNIEVIHHHTEMHDTSCVLLPPASDTGQLHHRWHADLHLQGTVLALAQDLMLTLGNAH
jgi:hypothetical protein